VLSEGTDLVWEDVPRRRAAPPRRPPRFSRLALAVAAVGLIATFLLIVTWPTEIGEPFDGVPRELSGRWVTSEPRYADRMIVIERDRVDLLLELGPEGRERYPIVEVRGWPAGGGRGYRIRYGADRGQVMDMFVAQDGTLRLKNRADVVWRRLPFVY
jgi:hypothetical protein